MHGIQTINAINSRNAEAERIMQAHGHQDFSLAVKPSQPSAFDDRYSRTDRVAHGSVQPWSAGALFPGVIVVTVEDDGTKRYAGSYRGMESGKFFTHECAENWIASRKAEFSKGVAR